MLEYVFLACAVIGGTVMVGQFALSLIGLGGDEVGDLSGDAADVSLGDSAHSGDASAGAAHGTDWLFGVLSFRTLVAAVAFFGLGGMIALKAGYEPLVALLAAIASGVAAMYGVYALLRGIYSLQSDGTLDLKHARGATGVVHIPIPAHGGGAGKVHVKIQGRLVECRATTAGDTRLASGCRVEVVDVLGSDTLEVEPLTAPQSESANQTPDRGVV